MTSAHRPVTLRKMMRRLRLENVTRTNRYQPCSSRAALATANLSSRKLPLARAVERGLYRAQLRDGWPRARPVQRSAPVLGLRGPGEVVCFRRIFGMQGQQYVDGFPVQVSRQRVLFDQRLRIDTAERAAGQQRHQIAVRGPDPRVRPVHDEHPLTGQQDVERVKVAVQQGMTGDGRRVSPGHRAGEGGITLLEGALKRS